MKTILVDGENVLRALGLIRGSDLTRAESFLQELERTAAEKDWEVVVVFDGPERYLRRESGLLTVCYAKPGTTADTVIERMVYEAPDRSGMVVVTRDRAEGNVALGLGALVWAPHRLAQEMKGRDR
ncbi:MAG: NYN domain-containing protein [Candidatus Omnitrophica bacterium]|nr:NYN domain-containing protein [Candidatus Omnitrophota bacterium]